MSAHRSGGGAGDGHDDDGRRRDDGCAPGYHDGLGDGDTDGIVALSAGGNGHAERRYLSVLFCDLQGSVSLSRRVDPEEYRSLLARYRAACEAVIARYGGGAVRHVGDGIRAYFGFPQALGNDAERAARAGLDIVAAVARLDLRPRLHVRVGIASGETVAGWDGAAGHGGASTRREPEAVGEPPNLAARAQQVASPDSVVAVDTTRRLLGRLFDFVDLGERSLKGLDRPVRLWRLCAPADPRGSSDRFAATRSHRAPLIGREEQIDILLRRWRQAERGAGQVVVISGEAGIGKSRLARSLHRHLRETRDHHWLYYHCSPFHSDSALYPIIAQIERDAGIDRRDDAARRLDKLARMLPRGFGTDAADGSGGDSRNMVPLLAALLSIPVDDRYPPLDVSSQQQKQLIFAALIERSRALAERKPLLIVFEDAHWIDPTSQELLELSVRAVQQARALMLVICRSDYRPSWLGEAHVSYLLLNRLGDDASVALADHILRARAGRVSTGVPAAGTPDAGGGTAATGGATPGWLRQVVAKADGVPLFLEELIGALDPERRGADHAAVPASVQEILTARLDRLRLARPLAQVGAVIGREFPADLLAAVLAADPDALTPALDELVADDVTRRHGSGGAAVYRFRHALLQEAAYHSLLRPRRRELHGRIGTLLARDFPTLWRARPELLARHLDAAGAGRQAAGYWLQAGRLAAEKSADVEAARHFRQGLRALGGGSGADTALALELRRRLARLAPAIPEPGGGRAAVESATGPATPGRERQAMDDR